jgi:hypothetical protein
MPTSKGRDRQQTVASTADAFALLTPVASESEAEGEATFLPEIGVQWVRRFTLIDRKKEPTNLTGIAKRQFFALIALRDAINRDDDSMASDARGRLELIYREREHQSLSQQVPDSPERHQLGEYLAPRVGMSPQESLKHFEGLRMGPKAYADSFRLLSYEIAQRMGLFTQLTVWRMKEEYRPRPAIYCLSPEVALYVHTFLLTPGAGCGWRVCPQCGEEFFQTRTSQEYWPSKCGSNYRSSNSRDNQKNKPD